MKETRRKWSLSNQWQVWLHELLTVVPVKNTEYKAFFCDVLNEVVSVKKQ